MTAAKKPAKRKAAQANTAAKDDPKIDALIEKFATVTNVAQVTLELEKAIDGLREGSIDPAQALRILRAAHARVRATERKLDPGANVAKPRTRRTRAGSKA